MPMGVPIGGRECKCIYPFEKGYITLALKELILKKEREMSERNQERKTLPPEEVETLEGILRIQKVLIRDLKTVEECVEATPECK